MLHENTTLLRHRAEPRITPPEPEEPEALTRSALLRPGSYDAETQSFTAVVATDYPVRRRDRRGVYGEVLDIANHDTSGYAGLPLIDGHAQASVRNVVGHVERMWTEGSFLVARLRLSSAPDVEAIAARIADGTIRNVSVGYAVERWDDTDSGDARSGRIRRARKFTIREVSLVPIPADPNAVIRSDTMPEETTEAVEETAPVETANRAETNAAIRTIAQTAGLTRDWINEQIDAEVTLDEVRQRAFDAMRSRSANNIRVQQVGPSNDDPAVIRDRMAEALACRMSGEEPSDAARPFMANSLVDNARALLAARGESTRGMNAEQVLTRAAQHTTSDFPILTTEAGNRVLAGAYQRAQSPVVTALTRRRTATDFRPISVVKTGEFSGLQKVTESGEIKAMTTGEAKEGFALETAGGIFNLSRKALVNDDLNAFGRWNEMMGRSAAEYEAAQVIALLTANSGAGPTMTEDGKALFHADHGNLAGTGSDIIGASGELAALSVARKALRDMTGLDGATPINATPKYLLVGTDRETEAEQALATINAATVGDVNPFGGKLSLLVEPRIATAWYVFADPGVLPVLECAYLSGAEGPQLASRDGWDVLGREFRVVLDFGCGAVDFRGAYRNAGA